MEVAEVVVTGVKGSPSHGFSSEAVARETKVSSWGTDRMWCSWWAANIKQQRPWHRVPKETVVQLHPWLLTVSTLFSLSFTFSSCKMRLRSPHRDLKRVKGNMHRKFVTQWLNVVGTRESFPGLSLFKKKSSLISSTWLKSNEDWVLHIFLTLPLMEYLLDSNFNSKGLWFASQLGDSSVCFVLLG